MERRLSERLAYLKEQKLVALQDNEFCRLPAQWPPPSHIFEFPTPLYSVSGLSYLWTRSISGAFLISRAYALTPDPYTDTELRYFWDPL